MSMVCVCLGVCTCVCVHQKTPSQIKTVSYYQGHEILTFLNEQAKNYQNT